MGVLSALSSGSHPWHWGYTEQHAFDEIKSIVNCWWDNHRVSLDYSPEADLIYLVTDASCTGASGYVCQGAEWRSMNIVTF
jgi:hypothetical protein